MTRSSAERRPATGTRGAGRRVAPPAGVRAVVLALAAVGLASSAGCYDYAYPGEEAGEDPARPETSRVDGDWTLLPDGSSLSSAQSFFHAKFDAAVPTASPERVGGCEASMPCHLWIDDIPAEADWEQVPYTKERPPSKYDLIVYRPGRDLKSHVAIVDHVEGGIVFVMDSDAHGDLRRAPRPHAWQGAPYGWFHLRKLDVQREEGGAAEPTTGEPTTGTPDAPAPAPGADAGTTGTCALGAQRCGGHGPTGAADVLYRCEAGGAASVVAKCANGCAVGAPGQEDACNPPTTCVVGGSYCGGDKVNGDPDVLYECGAGGATRVVMRCANGCAVNPGVDDRCQP